MSATSAELEDAYDLLRLSGSSFGGNAAAAVIADIDNNGTRVDLNELQQHKKQQEEGRHKEEEPEPDTKPVAVSSSESKHQIHAYDLLCFSDSVVSSTAFASGSGDNGGDERSVPRIDQQQQPKEPQEWAKEEEEDTPQKLNVKPEIEPESSSSSSPTASSIPERIQNGHHHHYHQKEEQQQQQKEEPNSEPEPEPKSSSHHASQHPTSDHQHIDQTQTQILKPTSGDILMGRGKHARMHPGNVMMLQLLDKHRDDYINAPNRKRKNSIVTQILNRLHESGARFLLKSSSSKSKKKNTSWEEITNQNEKYEKISHALRTKMKSSYTTIIPTTGDNSAVVDVVNNDNNDTDDGNKQQSKQNMIATASRNSSTDESSMKEDDEEEVTQQQEEEELNCSSGNSIQQTQQETRVKENTRPNKKRANPVVTDHDGNSSSTGSAGKTNKRFNGLIYAPVFQQQQQQHGCHTGETTVDIATALSATDSSGFSRIDSTTGIVQTHPSIITMAHSRQQELELLSQQQNRISVASVMNTPINMLPHPTLICPLTKSYLDNPVRNIQCGHVFSRDAIFHYIRKFQLNHSSNSSSFNDGTTTTITDPPCPVPGCSTKSIQLDEFIFDHEAARAVNIVKFHKEMQLQALRYNPHRRQSIDAAAAAACTGTAATTGTRHQGDSMVISGLDPPVFGEGRRNSSSSLSISTNTTTPTKKDTQKTDSPPPPSVPPQDTSGDAAAARLPKGAILEPTEDDILMGRGRHSQTHIGNLNMLRLVDKYRDDYTEGNRKRKGQIVQEIVHLLKESRGTRFLKKHQQPYFNNSHTSAAAAAAARSSSSFTSSSSSSSSSPISVLEYWIEATADEVHEKLCHALRTKTRAPLPAEGPLPIPFVGKKKRKSSTASGPIIKLPTRKEVACNQRRKRDSEVTSELSADAAIADAECKLKLKIFNHDGSQQVTLLPQIRKEITIDLRRKKKRKPGDSKLSSDAEKAAAALQMTNINDDGVDSQPWTLLPQTKRETTINLRKKKRKPGVSSKLSSDADKAAATVQLTNMNEDDNDSQSMTPTPTRKESMVVAAENKRLLFVPPVANHNRRPEAGVADLAITMAVNDYLLRKNDEGGR